MSYSRLMALNLGASQSGISLRATLVDASGTNISGQTNISNGFTELGYGKYLWNYTNFPSDTRFAVKFIDSSTSGIKALSSFNPEIDEFQALDTILTASHGSGAWGASLLGDYIATVSVTDYDGNIVGGANVNVFPSGDVNVLLNRAATNLSNGQVSFNLDNGNYHLYVSKPMWGTWLNPFNLTVSGNSSITVSGIRFAITAPAQSGTVRLYAFVSDLGLNAEEDVEMVVGTSGTVITDDDYYILQKPSSTKSDSNGYVYTDVAGSIPVRIRIPKADFETYITTPASGSLNIGTL